jgi:outer membrane protein
MTRMRYLMIRNTSFSYCAVLVIICATLSPLGTSQMTDDPLTPNLPSAPEPRKPLLTSQRYKSLPQDDLSAGGMLQQNDQSSASNVTASQTTQSARTAPLRLTRTDAEQLAIRNNPRISVGRLLALAQHQIYRETRAAELPTLIGSVTAVDANEGSRVGAGILNASILLEHAGAGVMLSQVLTDFGRTVNLVAYSKLLEKAQNANAMATTEDVVLATDQAFYNALEAQALLKVADQTVTTRQSVQHQINELTKNKLKSSLDLSFAEVNLSQAKLLQLDAKNNVDSTVAALTAVLGFDKEVNYQLAEEVAVAPTPPPDLDVLVSSALQQRPDLQASTYTQQASEKFRRAQRDQLFPSISALGTAGVTPVRPDCFGGCFPNYFISSWYGAIGVNMNVPIFNGFLFSSQAAEASNRAKAAAENTRDLRDRVVRDVRTAWLAANTAFQRVSVAQELSKQADLSLSLAQQRYQLGLGSIVELSQAQLQQTDAAIGLVNARYQYRLSLSTLNFEIGVQP